MKFLKIVFLLGLLLLPFGELFRINIAQDIAVRPLDICVGLSAVIAVFLYCFKTFSIVPVISRRLTFFVIVAAFSLLINISKLGQSQIIASSMYYLRWISYAMTYFIILNFDKNFNNLVKKLLILDGVLIIIFGFIQYFLYPNLRNLYYLGWDEHNYRMFSVFLDPNFAGSFFVLFLIFIAGALNEKINKGSGKEKKVLSVLIFISLIAVFLTYSRSAILMLIAGLTTYFLLIGKKKLVIGLFGSIFLILILLIPTFDKENTNLLRTASSFARIESYNNAIKIISDHPFLGVGFNTYRYAQETYGFREEETKYPSHADAGSDNSLLFLAATTGFVGLVAYLFMWQGILNIQFHEIKKKKGMSAVVISSIVGLLVNSFFINSLFFPEIMLWIWMIVGLAEVN